jgi:hypothetical protein
VDEGYDSWRGPLPSLRVTFAAPAVDAALIGALGRPASWREKASPVELLRPFVRAARELARTLALRTTAPDGSTSGDGSTFNKEGPGPGAGDPQQP